MTETEGPIDRQTDIPTEKHRQVAGRERGENRQAYRHTERLQDKLHLHRDRLTGSHTDIQT